MYPRPVEGRQLGPQTTHSAKLVSHLRILSFTNNPLIRADQSPESAQPAPLAVQLDDKADASLAAALAAGSWAVILPPRQQSSNQPEPPDLHFNLHDTRTDDLQSTLAVKLTYAVANSEAVRRAMQGRWL